MAYKFKVIPMKTIVLIIVSTFFLFIQDKKLQGKYRVEFDKKYELKGYDLTFTDDSYLKQMSDAVYSKGKITYGKFKSTLRKDNEEDPIEIDNRAIGKDTIAFSTKSKTDLSLTKNRGKMIRIK
jgi:hypothetical protein